MVKINSKLYKNYNPINFAIIQDLAERLFSRTICLMDSTGSMNNMIVKTKETIKRMFAGVNEILKENSIDEDTVQLQFVGYRNYSSGADILQISDWNNDPKRFEAFLNTVNSSGGQGNEAIEVALWHCNEEHKKREITQIILIGDMPPNSRSEVYEKSRGFYGNYPITFYEDEVKKLKEAKIPIHCFYVNYTAKSSFESIAKNTNGNCGELNINSRNGADILVDIFSVQILRNVGKVYNLGEDLVENYKKKNPNLR